MPSTTIYKQFLLSSYTCPWQPSSIECPLLSSCPNSTPYTSGRTASINKAPFFCYISTSQMSLSNPALCSNTKPSSEKPSNKNSSNKQEEKVWHTQETQPPAHASILFRYHQHAHTHCNYLFFLPSKVQGEMWECVRFHQGDLWQPDHWGYRPSSGDLKWQNMIYQTTVQFF